MMQGLRAWARALKRQVLTLWFCCRHPGTPLHARAMAVLVAGYAFSPIDLIPDFVPVLGYLDDVILVPLGVWVTLKMIPPQVLEECQDEATRWMEEGHSKPRNYLAAVLIVLVWVTALALCWLWWMR